MNAPNEKLPPPGATLVAQLPLDSMVPSLTNPRKTFDQAYIKELAASITQHGLIQPITVRELPASRTNCKANVLYEIVVGESRYRAAVEAGLKEIPAFWRQNLSDKETLEIQVIENLQRKDLHPLEEAEGFRALIDNHAYTAETLAEKIGVKRTTIFNSLKLLDLHPASRKAFQDGKITSKSIAMLIARIGDTKQQAAALIAITTGIDPDHHYLADGPLSYREAQEYVRDNFMLTLANAPFPRAEDNLIPGVSRCHDCPKRTGNNKDLFSDIKSPDVCTDPVCFNAKKAAHATRQRDLAKAEGRKIIQGAEAKKIMPFTHSANLNGGLVKLDKIVHDDEKQRTVRQIIGTEAAAKADLLINPHEDNEIIEVISADSLATHLKAKGITLRSSGANMKTSEQKEREKKERQKQVLQQQYRDQLVAGIRSAATQRLVAGVTPGDEDLVLIAEQMFRDLQFNNQKLVAELWMPDAKDPHAVCSNFRHSFIDRPAHELYRIMIDMAVVRTWIDSNLADEIEAMAKRYDIDPAALKARIHSDAKAKDEGKKAKAKPKKAKQSEAEKSAPTPSPAAHASEDKPPRKMHAMPKAKINPASAKPTKKPAAPAKNKTPNGNAKLKASAKSKASPAPAMPAKKGETPVDLATPRLKKSATTPWPFPTGQHPADIKGDAF